MTTYIVWPVSIDDVFRAAYKTIISENIQANPQINDTKDKYLVGSSRITQEQINSLQGDFPDVYFGDTPPENWVYGA